MHRISLRAEFRLRICDVMEYIVLYLDSFSDKHVSANICMYWYLYLYIYFHIYLSISFIHTHREIIHRYITRNVLLPSQVISNVINFGLLSHCRLTFPFSSMTNRLTFCILIWEHFSWFAFLNCLSNFSVHFYWMYNTVWVRFFFFK